MAETRCSLGVQVRIGVEVEKRSGRGGLKEKSCEAFWQPVGVTQVAGWMQPRDDALVHLTLRKPRVGKHEDPRAVGELDCTQEEKRLRRFA